MMYCLDTDTVIEFLKGNPKVVEKIKEIETKGYSIAITFLTLYEFYKGVHTSPNPKEDLESLNKLLQKMSLLDLSSKSCYISGKIYSDLKKKGEIINDADILIAGIVIANKQTFVTNNTKHFKRIENLKIEVWI